MQTTPANRNIDPAESSALATQIRRANERLAKAELVSDEDEGLFSDLVLRYFETSSPEDVLALVKSGEIPKEHPVFGTPIILAAELGMFDLLEPLRELGCSFDSAGGNYSALIAALNAGHHDMTGQTVTKLLSLGAKMGSGGAPLAHSAATHSTHLIETLLNYGADPNEICPASGRTPLNAVFTSALSADEMLSNLDILLKRGADPNLRSSGDDLTPLKNLARRPELKDGVKPIFSALLAAGLRLTDEYEAEKNALSTCVFWDNDILGRLMLENGTDPRSVLTDEYAALPTDLQLAEALEWIAGFRMPMTVAYMIEKLGADPAHKLPCGGLLADKIDDLATKEILRAGIVAQQINHVLDTPEAPSQPRRGSSPSL